MNDTGLLQRDPASELAIEIQSLVANPEIVSWSPGRSPLFQIAAHLDISKLPQLPKPETIAITEKIFANIRREALKSQCRQNSNRSNMTKEGVSR
jgi:hypothetical protein